MRSAAIVIFALVGCFSAIHMLYLVWVFPSGSMDISAEENIYSALGPYLPGRGTVGYETDDAKEGGRKYFIAQYALCPLVVEKDVCHEYVIRERGGVIEILRSPEGGK